MPGVTTGADRGHRKSLLEESFAVNAVLVPFENLLFGKIMGAFHLGALGVTLSAHAWNVER